MIFAIRALLAGCGLACTLSAHAQNAPNYPAKPIRFIIPFPPGGPTDLMGRTAGDRLARAWNVQVIADNRAGAGGNIGTELCAKSPPDGYTMCMMTVAQVISPAVYKKLAFDPIRDFSHITLMAMLPSMLTTHPALPVKTVKDVIALAKTSPGQLTYASTGNGTSPHMLMEMFSAMSGVKMVHVPYKGQAPAVVDQIAGQIQLAFNTAATVIPYAQAGKLKAIAISTKERFPPMPSLPTVEEGGIKGFDGSSWQSVVMPANVPREIVAKVYQELSAMLKSQEVRDRFLAQGALASGIAPDQFTAFAKLEMDKWAKVAKFANIRLD
ncbi:MAG: tripartite tricarboxylate transporter substrate binding protein [Burkholderiales bacterium]